VSASTDGWSDSHKVAMHRGAHRYRPCTRCVQCDALTSPPTPRWQRCSPPQSAEQKAAFRTGSTILPFWVSDPAVSRLPRGRGQPPPTAPPTPASDHPLCARVGMHQSCGECQCLTVLSTHTLADTAATTRPAKARRTTSARSTLRRCFCTAPFFFPRRRSLYTQPARGAVP
jgi:hypothetical protein